MHLKVLPGPALAERTTLRLGGPALAEVRIGSERVLDKLPGKLAELGGRPLVLGQGSNILAADEELPVVVLGVPEIAGPEVVFERGEEVVVQAGAATPLPVLLSWCAKRGLSGMEGLSGIPGRLGGAVAMNAGSYGNDVSQVLERVRLFSPCCGLRWAGREDVGMGYRHFDPGTVVEYFLILAVELRLRRAAQGAVRAAMDEAMAKKKASQPIGAASAGCVFKNPADGPPAGKLLDDAGLKGRRLGDMAFSDLHANFMVNLGAGTAAQAFELIETAREAVAAGSGPDLELEVKVVA